ncbi:hypothetical protein B0T13DRAFT_473428 [Neurospora crassa]|nr:hypothetical protein B0T13DRAFT_473428 [Neurospora crassa]
MAHSLLGVAELLISLETLVYFCSCSWAIPYIVNTHVKIIKFGVIALERKRDIITNHGQESLDGHGPLAHTAPSG